MWRDLLDSTHGNEETMKHQWRSLFFSIRLLVFTSVNGKWVDYVSLQLKHQLRHVFRELAFSVRSALHGH